MEFSHETMIQSIERAKSSLQRAINTYLEKNPDGEGKLCKLITQTCDRVASNPKFKPELQWICRQISSDVNIIQLAASMTLPSNDVMEWQIISIDAAVLSRRYVEQNRMIEEEKQKKEKEDEAKMNEVIDESLVFDMEEDENK